VNDLFAGLGMLLEIGVLVAFGVHIATLPERRGR
jgi:hypothetical protein